MVFLVVDSYINNKFVMSVLEYISNNIQNQSGLDIHGACEHFSLSKRVFQRRLQKANTTYEKLRDEARRHFALIYIAERRYSISDIAFKLDYADRQSLSKSFRRWTGLTFEQYRKALTIEQSNIPLPTGL